MIIDVFSKYGWTIPLKKKTGLEVTNEARNQAKHVKIFQCKQQDEVHRHSPKFNKEIQ